MKTNAWIGDLVSQLRVIRAWSRILTELEHLPLAERLRSDAFDPFLEASWIPNISTLEGQLADLTNARFDALISRLLRRLVATNSTKLIPLDQLTKVITKCLSEEEPANGEAVSLREEVGIPNGLDPDTLVRAWVGQFRAWRAWTEQDKAITQAQEEKRTARQRVLLAACADLGERLKQANLPWWNPLRVIPTPGRQALFQEVQLAFPHLRQYVSEVSAMPVELPAPGDDWVPKLLQELASTLRPNQEGQGGLAALFQYPRDEESLRSKGDAIETELGGGVWQRALALTAYLGLEACGPPLDPQSAQEALRRFLQRLLPEELEYSLSEETFTPENRRKEETTMRVASAKKLVLDLKSRTTNQNCRRSSLSFPLSPAPGLLQVALNSARDVLERLGFGEPFPSELRSLLECHNLTEATRVWKPLQKHWPVLCWYLQRLCLLLDTTPEGRLAAANLLGAFEELGFGVVPAAKPDNGNSLTISQPGGGMAQPNLRLNVLLRSANLAPLDETSPLAVAWKAWQMAQRLGWAIQKRLRPLADALLGLDYRTAVSGAAPTEQQVDEVFFPLVNELFKIGSKGATAKEKQQLDEFLSLLKEWGRHYELMILPSEWSFAKPFMYTKEMEKNWVLKKMLTSQFEQEIQRRQIIVEKPRIGRAGKLVQECALFVSVGKKPECWDPIGEALKKSTINSLLRTVWKEWEHALVSDEDEGRTQALHFYSELWKYGQQENGQRVLEWKPNYSPLLEYYFRLVEELYGLRRWEPRKTTDRLASTLEKQVQALNRDANSTSIKKVVCPGLIDQDGRLVYAALVYADD